VAKMEVTHGLKCVRVIFKPFTLKSPFFNSNSNLKLKVLSLSQIMSDSPYFCWLFRKSLDFKTEKNETPRFSLNLIMNKILLSKYK
jgi:hypothetical protein